MSSASTTSSPPARAGFDEAKLQAFLSERDEPAWLRQRRRDAFATFLAAPWPTARDEEWRRTDIRSLKLDAFAPSSRQEPAAADVASIEPLWQSLSASYGTGI